MNYQSADSEFEIDLLRLFRILWSKIWIIIISMAVGGTVLFSYSYFRIQPTYQSQAMLYVNNYSLSIGTTSLSVSTGELSAAKSLLDVYTIILKTRNTLEDVIERAGLDYSYGQLSSMISAKSVNNTEIFSVTVTSTDPEEAKLIVDTIVDILPDKVSEVIERSSVRLVDHAVVAHSRSGPSYSKYALIGILAGAVASCAVIIILDLMDTSIHDEEYLSTHYGLPILAVIPNANSKTAKYKYYKGYYGGYYYGGGDGKSGKRASSDSASHDAGNREG